ncbi:zinc finger protein 34-like [Ambystoma mexicanum]|uniref:zinc finger protein 34-like n=1 Tax=Ambystoma mexicanum TaxID=8296 RepID=UPI0037E71325
MSWKDSDEVLFHEASSYFSEEEWKLLHEWQKALYSNVMKEIHQALISLGPLIATTVCSIRDKEKGELLPLDNQVCEIRHRINHSPTGDNVRNPGVLFKMSSEDLPYLDTPQYSEESERRNCLQAGVSGFKTDNHVSKEEEPAPIFIDHLGAEIGESTADPNLGYDVVSFSIKDEKETYCIDHEEIKRMESSSGPKGDGSKNRRRKIQRSIKCSEKTAPCKAFSEKTMSKPFQSTHQENNSMSQVFPEGYTELSGETRVEYDSVFTNTVRFSLDHASPNIERTHTFGESESNLKRSQLLKSLPSTQQRQRVKSILKGDHTRRTRTPSRARQYPCMECEKSFFEKSHLITHRRTHSGEKPYACTFCYKRFNRKDNLNVHVRIHTGETPYKCRKCEKNFRRKSELVDHQSKHPH